MVERNIQEHLPFLNYLLQNQTIGTWSLFLQVIQDLPAVGSNLYHAQIQNESQRKHFATGQCFQSLCPGDHGSTSLGYVQSPCRDICAAVGACTHKSWSRPLLSNSNNHPVTRTDRKTSGFLIMPCPTISLCNPARWVLNLINSTSFTNGSFVNMRWSTRPALWWLAGRRLIQRFYALCSQEGPLKSSWSHPIM